MKCSHPNQTDDEAMVQACKTPPTLFNSPTLTKLTLMIMVLMNDTFHEKHFNTGHMYLQACQELARAAIFNSEGTNMMCQKTFEYLTKSKKK